MIQTRKASAFVIGLALFSMFFGGGNLIFPLYVGKLAQDQWISTAIGFLLTGVIMPFLGVIAMVLFEGDYNKFFSCMGKVLGFLVPLVLLTVWIPLGSAPRCISLSYASIAAYVNLPPVWVFGLIYCFFLFFMVRHPDRMLNILGYVLTPLLLGCLFMITFKGLGTSPSGESFFNQSETFYRGAIEGYNTMDLIASFFFSASIIQILKKTTTNRSQALKLVMKSGIIGVTLLGIVYMCLVYLASAQRDFIQNIPKEQLLAHIAKTILGVKLGAIAALAIVLACFTTSTALVVVYADFIAKNIIRNPERKTEATIITLVITFVMSIFGLDGITTLTAPILQIFYPMLVILIIFNIGRALIATRKTATLTLPACPDSGTE